MYIPAWFIYYTKTYGNMQLEYTLVLNAIDGGRMIELPTDVALKFKNKWMMTAKSTRELLYKITFKAK
jgi:hypothetical protein